MDPQFHWDTWVVPTLGGEPQPLLRNASGLVWTGPRQVLFSEIKMGVHMGIVAAEESRIGAREIYLPADEFAMAHRFYLSPDSRSVLLVEMDIDHLWEPCRVVPADGSSPGQKVGRPGRAALRRPGRRMESGSISLPMQLAAITSGGSDFPMASRNSHSPVRPKKEGIAMAPDGRSFVTAMALQNTSLWVHDAGGERQISLEGNAAQPRFTPDGKKLLCRIVKEAPSEFGFYRDLGELRIVDLKSSSPEPLVRGVPGARL